MSFTIHRVELHIHNLTYTIEVDILFAFYLNIH